MKPAEAAYVIAALGTGCNEHRCEPGVLPFEGQSLVPVDTQIRVDLSVHADFDGVSYRDVIRLSGPDGAVDLSFVGEVDRVVTMAPRAALREGAVYTIDVDLWGPPGQTTSLFLQSSPGYRVLPVSARFQTGGALRALAAEERSDGYLLLLSAPAPPGWDRDHLLACAADLLPDPDCHPVVFETTDEAPQLAHVSVPLATERLVLWSLDGGVWSPVPLRSSDSDEALDLVSTATGAGRCEFFGGR